MGLDPILALMPDGPQRKFTLMDAEGRLAQLHLGPPQLLDAPVTDVGARHVTAFAVAGPVVPLGPRRPLEPNPRGPHGIGLQLDQIAARGARMAFR